MSNEVPAGIGELSRYALEEAIGKIDRALADAPDDFRAAVSTVRLVTGIPRRVPWYGAVVDAGQAATAGTVMLNLVECYWGSEYYRKEVKRRLEIGRREYCDYLDHLADPLRFEQEAAEQRLSAGQAAAMRAWIAGGTSRPLG